MRRRRRRRGERARRRRGGERRATTRLLPSGYDTSTIFRHTSTLPRALFLALFLAHFLSSSQNRLLPSVTNFLSESHVPEIRARLRRRRREGVRSPIGGDDSLHDARRSTPRRRDALHLLRLGPPRGDGDGAETTPRAAIARGERPSAVPRAHSHGRAPHDGPRDGRIPAPPPTAGARYSIHNALDVSSGIEPATVATASRRSVPRPPPSRETSATDAVAAPSPENSLGGISHATSAELVAATVASAAPPTAHAVDHRPSAAARFDPVIHNTPPPPEGVRAGDATRSSGPSRISISAPNPTPRFFASSSRPNRVVTETTWNPGDGVDANAHSIHPSTRANPRAVGVRGEVVNAHDASSSSSRAPFDDDLRLPFPFAAPHPANATRARPPRRRARSSPPRTGSPTPHHPHRARRLDVRIRRRATTRPTRRRRRGTETESGRAPRRGWRTAPTQARTPPRRDLRFRTNTNTRRRSRFGDSRRRDARRRPRRRRRRAARRRPERPATISTKREKVARPSRRRTASSWSSWSSWSSSRRSRRSFDRSSFDRSSCDRRRRDGARRRTRRARFLRAYLLLRSEARTSSSPTRQTWRPPRRRPRRTADFPRGDSNL